MRDFHLPGRSPVISANGMCATSHPLASKTAVSLLESGGNAMDAAIAAAFVIGFCEPPMAGIGGDCFVLFTPPGSDEVKALNGSGRAPSGASAEALRARGCESVPLYGEPAAITLPGAVDAFCKLSADWGKLGLEACLAPAIHYAEAGVPIAPRVAFSWADLVGNLSGEARERFLFDGAAPRQGQIFKAPGQAEALRRVARDGREGFYEGEVAEDMASSLQALGGAHTLEDFASVSCEYTTPISGGYGDVELFEHPPNGQGATAILMNSMLGHFDLASMDPLGSERAHIEAEAAKLAYDARDRFIADQDHATRLDHMLDEMTAAALAAQILPDRTLDAGDRSVSEIHQDTIYLCVVDRDLMCVSLIYSLFHGLGSGLCSRKFGIPFHNRGAGFSLEPGHPNELAGGKRPLHTIIPAMLKRGGKVIMPFGVMGGHYQPNGHARVITNMVDYGMDPQSAIDAPRSFHDGGGLLVERGYSDAVRSELSQLGHDVSIPKTPIGGSQAILIDHEAGTLEGASDPRKDGCALGC